MGDSAGRGEIHYNVHEFGVTGQQHPFTYWPGFTLNPAMWNVPVLRARVQAAGGFNSTDPRFEQSLSLKLFASGVAVAYLPQLNFQHVGVDVSAYVLNNASRPWDDASSHALGQ